MLATSEIETVTAPVYWASYIIGGDDSGLLDGEPAKIKAWLATLPGRILAVCDGEWFAWTSDGLPGVGATVCEYLVICD